MKKAEEVEVEVAADPCCTILDSIEWLGLAFVSFLLLVILKALKRVLC